MDGLKTKIQPDHKAEVSHPTAWPLPVEATGRLGSLPPVPDAAGPAQATSAQRIFPADRCAPHPRSIGPSVCLTGAALGLGHPPWCLRPVSVALPPLLYTCRNSSCFMRRFPLVAGPAGISTATLALARQGRWWPAGPLFSGWGCFCGASQASDAP